MALAIAADDGPRLIAPARLKTEIVIMSDYYCFSVSGTSAGQRCPLASCDRFAAFVRGCEPA